MENLYLPIKHIHWLIIILSIVLYNIKFWRRTLSHLTPNKPKTFFWKVIPPINDSFLLLSGILMIWIGKWSLWGEMKWLGIKLLCVFAYIILGIIAMKSPAKSMKSLIFYGLSMMCIAVIIYLVRFKPI